MIPLWPYHLRRLKEAHTHFAERDGEDIWGIWPGDEGVWEKVRDKLEGMDKGDYRVCLSPTDELSERSEYYFTQTPSSRCKPHQLLLMPVSLGFLFTSELKFRTFPAPYTR